MHVHEGDRDAVPCGVDYAEECIFREGEALSLQTG